MPPIAHIAVAAEYDRALEGATSIPYQTGSPLPDSPPVAKVLVENVIKLVYVVCSTEASVVDCRHIV